MRIIIKLIQSAQHIFPNQHRKPVDDSIIVTAQLNTKIEDVKGVEEFSLPLDNDEPKATPHMIKKTICNQLVSWPVLTLRVKKQHM